jgi:monofunctional biosynthetic peptidoglycan transglycosylase
MFLYAALLVAFYGGACCSALLLLKWVDPPFTMVHLQRRVESWFGGPKYRKQYAFVSLSRISPHLRHAVIAAEDGRFYQHSGVDWAEIGKMIETELPDGRIRGVSTITQQLVKNLFMTTHRNPLRKPVEFALAPVAETILGKERILELYLNVVEWGPGVYGAEAAARRHYQTSAGALSRDRAARLAAILPSPRRWKPERMDRYAAVIEKRMASQGW